MQRKKHHAVKNYSIDPFNMSNSESNILRFLLQSQQKTVIFRNSTATDPFVHTVTHCKRNSIYARHPSTHTTYNISITHTLVRYKSRKHEDEERIAICGQTLGQGAQGIVYKITGRFKIEDNHLDLKIKQLIAKFMTPYTLVMTDEISRDSALNEYMIMKRLDAVYHPRPVAYDRVQNINVLLSCWFNGVALSQFLYKPRRIDQMPFVQLILLCIQMLSALKRLHAAGIVHRDLKPENILLETTAENFPVNVHIIDTGLSREVEMQGTERHEVGTPIYVAPETWAGAGSSQPADIFAMGRLFWLIFCNFANVSAFLDGDMAPVCNGALPTMDYLFKNSCYPDPIKAHLYLLFYSMNQPDPANRATIDQCLAQLGAITMLSMSYHAATRLAAAHSSANASTYSPTLFALPAAMPVLETTTNTAAAAAAAPARTA